MLWVGFQAAAMSCAQAQAMAVAGKEPSRLDPRRTEMRQAVQTLQLPRQPDSTAERRLSAQERAELRQLLRLSAERREDDARR